MVVFRQLSEGDVSSAHLAVFQRWIRSGGVAYFCSDALHGSLFKKLRLASPYGYSVVKESGAVFRSKSGGECIGELFVKDLLKAIAR